MRSNELNMGNGERIKAIFNLFPSFTTIAPDIPTPRPRPWSLPPTYIPFASLLGLQAALEPLVHKQPATDAAFIGGIDFADPRLEGGSTLDHDSGGLGEPLNVSLFPFFFFFAPP